MLKKVCGWVKGAVRYVGNHAKQFIVGAVVGGSVASATTVRAEDTIATSLTTAATGAITTATTLMGTVLVAAMVIITGFFIFKKAKQAINKA